MARYQKAHADWRLEVERILSPWRARNLNIQKSWQKRKLVAGSFLEQSLYSSKFLESATDRQLGLDFGDQDTLPKNVLLPSVKYFLSDTVEGATIPK